MVIKTSKNEQQNFYCKDCDYHTSRKYNWDRHIFTLKHKMVTNGNKNEQNEHTKNVFVCECGKIYKFSTGLSRHKKICTYVEKQQVTPNLEKQLETKGIEIDKKDKQLDELMKTVNELIPNIGTNNIINNTTNNTINNINIQLFLDKNCSDAMSIQYFVNQLSIKLGDLIKQKNNLNISIPNILIENLKPLAITERPMHLDLITDNKNPIWMVKDDIEGWKKDDGQIVIKHTEHKIYKQFQELWDNQYPNWKSDNRLKELNLELWTCLLNDNSGIDINKILKKIEPGCKLTIKSILDCKNIN